MKKADFDTYIARFNEEDPGAFETYMAPDVRMLNGTLELISTSCGLLEDLQILLLGFGVAAGIIPEGPVANDLGKADNGIHW